MKNILVTVDFTGEENALTKIAEDLALRFAAKIWLLHVSVGTPDYVGYDVGPQYIRDIRANELRSEHKQIQNIAASLQNKGIQAEGLLIQGATVEMILSEAKKLNCDLILSGHHDHNLFYRLMIGSTSHELLNKTKIPLMVVPLS